MLHASSMKKRMTHVTCYYIQMQLLVTLIGNSLVSPCYVYACSMSWRHHVEKQRVISACLRLISSCTNCFLVILWTINTLWQRQNGLHSVDDIFDFFCWLNQLYFYTVLQVAGDPRTILNVHFVNPALLIGILRSPCDNALRWMPQDLLLSQQWFRYGLARSSNKALPEPILTQSYVGLLGHNM